MTTKITTTNYHIVDSNIVILFEKDSDLTLHFEFDDFKFDVKFIFKTEKISRDIKKKVNGNMIEFECVNFNNPLGTGTINPIDIATIEDKNLYIHFWSQLYMANEDSSVRKFEYTVFLER